MIRTVRRLAGDDRGATIVEFAIVAPTFLLLLIGVLELGHRVYAETVIRGGLQDAARSSTLESGSTNLTVIDNRLREQIRRVAPDADVTITRRNYANYDTLGEPEVWGDDNGNGVCDNGEQFEDANGNRSWDRDGGQDGVGGARDIVLMRADVKYRALFPLWKFLGTSETNRISGSTVLQNQPFDNQTIRETAVLSC